MVLSVNILAGNTALYTAIIFGIIALVLFLILKTRLAYGARIFLKEKTRKNQKSLEEAIEESGYKYDPRQDIFYSHLDAWQRKFGYCRLYDEAAAPLGMIIDCEPIYFEYSNKRWLIELWKGQYDLTTGCEIGVYSTDGLDLNIPGIFQGGFYDCARDDELLHMAYSLKKRGRTLFTRKGKHWWLTGFKLGEFSEPHELIMLAKIMFQDSDMCNAFVDALGKLGYQKGIDYKFQGKVVLVKFDKPRSPQPMTRTAETDALIQKKNQLMCEQFQELTKEYRYSPNKIHAVKENMPAMYEEALKVGKTRKLYEAYEMIKKYL